MSAVLEAPSIQLDAKLFQLPISRGYVAHWGMAEGVREIMQNAIDSDSPFEYEFNGDTLVVRSRFSTLDASTLLLGSTSKAGDDEAIGSFGEGYKIAMLVLVRAEYSVRILNGPLIWTPFFMHSTTFNAEVLAIEETTNPAYNQGLAFEVSGLSDSDIADIRASCLFMQDHIGAVHTTSYGKILREKPGKLFVGGLFICDTELEFGYDFKPEYLRLERDRQTVNTFDLKWKAKDMWFETEQWDELTALIESRCPDLEYAHHGTPEELTDAVYQSFRSSYPGAVAVSSERARDEALASGISNIVVVPHFHSILAYSSAYQRDIEAMPAPQKVKLSPKERLAEFMRSNRKGMRASVKVAFKALLADADEWSSK